jgi:hypothetical protein
MTTQGSFSTTAIEVVGQYNQAAKSLVATYRTGTERVVGGIAQRCAKLVHDTNLPLISDGVKEQLVSAEERVAGFVLGTVNRACERADAAIDRVSTGTAQGITLLDEKTTWANDLRIVNALRPVNLRAAQLSLQLAERVAQGAGKLSERVAGAEAAEEAPARKRAARKPAKAAKPVVAKRTRRAKAEVAEAIEA